MTLSAVQLPQINNPAIKWSHDSINFLILFIQIWPHWNAKKSLPQQLQSSWKGIPRYPKYHLTIRFLIFPKKVFAGRLSPNTKHQTPNQCANIRCFLLQPNYSPFPSPLSSLFSLLVLSRWWRLCFDMILMVIILLSRNSLDFGHQCHKFGQGVVPALPPRLWWSNMGSKFRCSLNKNNMNCLEASQYFAESNTGLK